MLFSVTAIHDEHDLLPYTGIFKKEGDMTFIMGSDPFYDDFEGGSEENKRKKRNAVIFRKYLWSGAVVPYEIATVFGGMLKYQSNTYLQFYA